MCIGGSPKAPATASITPVIQPSQAISDQSQMTAAAELRRLQSMAGFQSTILTGAGGAATPTGAAKTLIGQ
jgi:hypothetical protein